MKKLFTGLILMLLTLTSFAQSLGPIDIIGFFNAYPVKIFTSEDCNIRIENRYDENDDIGEIIIALKKNFETTRFHLEAWEFRNTVDVFGNPTGISAKFTSSTNDTTLNITKYGSYNNPNSSDGWLTVEDQVQFKKNSRGRIYSFAVKTFWTTDQTARKLKFYEECSL